MEWKGSNPPGTHLGVRGLRLPTLARVVSGLRENDLNPVFDGWLVKASRARADRRDGKEWQRKRMLNGGERTSPLPQRKDAIPIPSSLRVALMKKER